MPKTGCNAISSSSGATSSCSGSQLKATCPKYHVSHAIRLMMRQEPAAVHKSPKLHPKVKRPSDKGSASSHHVKWGPLRPNYVDRIAHNANNEGKDVLNYEYMLNLSINRNYYIFLSVRKLDRCRN